MIFDHSNKSFFKIKFSWKERIRLFLKGEFILDRKSAYQFSTHFMRMVADTSKIYGDIREHGEVFENEELKTK